MKKQLFVLLIQTMAMGAQGAVSPFVFEESKQVRFLAVGKPAMLKISGHGKGPSIEIHLDGKKISGRFEVQLSELETGISLRDQHMKEKYLEVSKFPKATLELNAFELPQDLALLKDALHQQKFSGTLQLHSVSKPVEGVFNLEPSADRVLLKASYNINLSDFGIEVPNYAGIKVADVVEIETQFEVKK
jgi:polyisoprenoid-binding protein YceI